MGEEEPTVTLHQVVEQSHLLVQEQLGIAVVAHVECAMHPGPSGNQIAGKDQGPIVAGDLGEHQAGGVTEADVKRVGWAQDLAGHGAGAVVVGVLDNLQAATVRQQGLQGGDEAGPVAIVRVQRALPGGATHDETGVGEEQRGGLVDAPGCEQAAGVVEVQVGEHHDVDVGMGQLQGLQAVEQDVVLLHDAETVSQLGREEGANAGLEQDAPVVLDDEQGPTRQEDPISLVGRSPALPQDLGGVAEHGPAIQALGVAFDGKQAARHAGGLRYPSPIPVGLRQAPRRR